MNAAPELHTLAGRTVLLRGDFREGVSSRLARTVALLAAEGARVAVVGALGEPQGEFNPVLSLRQFRALLEELSGVSVSFIPESVGETAEALLAQVPFGAAALLENVRFHPLERRDSRAFAIRLSCLADHFADCGPAPARPLAWHAEIARLLPAPPLALPSDDRGN